jgi:uncharacterized protein YecT (DUF1311 family)
MRRVAFLAATVLSLGLMAQPSDREIVRQVLGQFGDLVQRVDCDSCEGVTPCYRICADLEFIRLDSLMELEFDRLLKAAPNDSTRGRLRDHHQQWIAARRGQCGLLGEGWRDSWRMIFYVDCMNELTRLRTTEIGYLRKVLTQEE